MKQIRHIIEFCGFFFIYITLRALPCSISKMLGGKLARFTGPFLPAQKIGLKNLTLAFPQKSLHERKAILKNMWEHFGRVCAEYCHTFHFAKMHKSPHITVQGGEYVISALKNHSQAIFISAHFGNWAFATSLLYEFTQNLIMIHRPPNNPYVNKMFHYIQSPFCLKIIEKSPSAGIHILKHLKKGNSVVMLLDQKNNSGITSTFFGQEAKTSPSAARLSQVLQIPIIPFYGLREKKGWQIVFEKPLAVPKSSEYVELTTQQLNQTFERWIRENPEQWFWVHRRFDKKIYKS